MITDYTVVLGQAETPVPPATAAGTAQNPGFLPTPPAISGLPANVVGGSITLSFLFVSLLIAWVAIKVYKSKVKDIVLGVCVGVLGAGTFVGAIAWTIIGIVVKAINAIAGSFG